MPSPFTGQKELASRVGLRGLCTNRADDMASHPLITEFWKKVAGLCDKFYMKSMPYIRSGRDVQEAATNLFDAYAPELWKRPTVEGARRDWLYEPGQGSPKCTPYAAELYYDDDKDRDFLRTTILQLIIEKILRKHKDQYRQSLAAVRQSSEASFGGDTSQFQTTFQCFGSGAPITNHHDATWLKQHGVWLGDFDEEKVQVNGLSFDEIQARYFDDTTGGTETSGVEPFVLNVAPQTCQLSVECKACAGQSGSIDLKADLYEFEWTDDDTETTMLKHVWTYVCSLNGQKVFALLKQVPEHEQKRLGSTSTLYHFWHIDGGYTKTAFLSQVEPQDEPQDVAVGPVASMQRTRPAGSVLRKRLAHFARKSAPTTGIVGTGIVGKGKKRARDSDHLNGAAELLRRINADEDDEDDGDHKATMFSAKRVQTVEPSRPPAVQDDNDWDSLYDVTPAPEDGARKIAQHNEATRADPSRQIGRSGIENEVEDRGPGLPESTALSIRARSVTLPPPGEPQMLRFDLWVSLPNSEDYKIVKSTHCLSVGDLFAALQKKFDRIVAGREILGVAVAIPDKKGRIVIEKEDADEWATVIGIAKSSGLEELYGIVEVAD